MLRPPASSAASGWRSSRASRGRHLGPRPDPRHRLPLSSWAMRLLRALVTFKLGVFTGLAAAGAFVKLAVPAFGDADSDELSLVAVFNGIQLESRAKAFRDCMMLSRFGGIEVDLRSAELAPGARLSVNTLFGGIALRTPPGWRIESNVQALAGGVAVRTPAQDDPAAPMLTLVGTTVFGGIVALAEAGDASL